MFTKNAEQMGCSGDPHAPSLGRIPGLPKFQEHGQTDDFCPACDCNMEIHYERECACRQSVDVYCTMHGLCHQHCQGTPDTDSLCYGPHAVIGGGEDSTAEIPAVEIKWHSPRSVVDGFRAFELPDLPIEPDALLKTDSDRVNYISAKASFRLVGEGATAAGLFAATETVPIMLGVQSMEQPKVRLRPGPCFTVELPATVLNELQGLNVASRALRGMQRLLPKQYGEGLAAAEYCALLNQAISGGDSHICLLVRAHLIYLSELWAQATGARWSPGLGDRPAQLADVNKQPDILRPDTNENAIWLDTPCSDEITFWRAAGASGDQAAPYLSGSQMLRSPWAISLPDAVSYAILLDGPVSASSISLDGISATAMATYISKYVSRCRLEPQFEVARALSLALCCWPKQRVTLPSPQHVADLANRLTFEVVPRLMLDSFEDEIIRPVRAVATWLCRRQLMLRSHVLWGARASGYKKMLADGIEVDANRHITLWAKTATTSLGGLWATLCQDKDPYLRAWAQVLPWLEPNFSPENYLHRVELEGDWATPFELASGIHDPLAPTALAFASHSLEWRDAGPACGLTTVRGMLHAGALGALSDGRIFTKTLGGRHCLSQINLDAATTAKFRSFLNKPVELVFTGLAFRSGLGYLRSLERFSRHRLVPVDMPAATVQPWNALEEVYRDLDAVLHSADVNVSVDLGRGLPVIDDAQASARLIEFGSRSWHEVECPRDGYCGIHALITACKHLCMLSLPQMIDMAVAWGTDRTTMWSTADLTRAAHQLGICLILDLPTGPSVLTTQGQMAAVKWRAGHYTALVPDEHSVAVTRAQKEVDATKEDGDGQEDATKQASYAAFKTALTTTSSEASTSGKTVQFTEALAFTLSKLPWHGKVPHGDAKSCATKLTGKNIRLGDMAVIDDMVTALHEIGLAKAHSRRARSLLYASRAIQVRAALSTAELGTNNKATDYCYAPLPRGIEKGLAQWVSGNVSVPRCVEAISRLYEIAAIGEGVRIKTGLAPCFLIASRLAQPVRQLISKLIVRLAGLTRQRLCGLLLWFTSLNPIVCKHLGPWLIEIAAPTTWHDGCKWLSDYVRSKTALPCGYRLHESDIVSVSYLHTVAEKAIGELDWATEIERRTQDPPVIKTPRSDRTQTRDKSFEELIYQKMMLMGPARPKFDSIDEWWEHRSLWAVAGAAGNGIPEPQLNDIKEVAKETELALKISKQQVVESLGSKYGRQMLAKPPTVRSHGHVKKNELGGKVRSIFGTDFDHYAISAFVSSVSDWQLKQDVFGRGASARAQRHTAAHLAQLCQRKLAVLSFDYTDFNAQHTIGAMQAVYRARGRWIKQSGLPQTLTEDLLSANDWLIASLDNMWISGGETDAVRAKFGLLSGFRDTAYLNSWLNWAYSRHIFAEAEDVPPSVHSPQSIVFEAYQGDDCLLVFKNSARAEWWALCAHELGYEANAAKCLMLAGTGEFLRMWYTPQGAQLGSLCRAIGSWMCGNWDQPGLRGRITTATLSSQAGTLIRRGVNPVAATVLTLDTMVYHRVAKDITEAGRLICCPKATRGWVAPTVLRDHAMQILHQKKSARADFVAPKAIDDRTRIRTLLKRAVVKKKLRGYGVADLANRVARSLSKLTDLDVDHTDLNQAKRETTTDRWVAAIRLSLDESMPDDTMGELGTQVTYPSVRVLGPGCVSGPRTSGIGLARAASKDDSKPVDLIKRLVTLILQKLGSSLNVDEVIETIGLSQIEDDEPEPITDTLRWDTSLLYPTQETIGEYQAIHLGSGPIMVRA